MQFPNARILIFAKAPQPGKVKTRLIPRLGESGASDFHEKCIRLVVGRRIGANLAPVVLYASPNGNAPLFIELAGRHPIQLADQQGPELGERMLSAARDSLRDADAVLLTGTDAPALNNTYLHAALAGLYEGVDVVMQPASDGGYVMLGIRSAYPALFTDMPWGSDKVAQQTRERCRSMGLRLLELPLSWDVDRPEDYDRLGAEGGLSTYRD